MYLYIRDSKGLVRSQYIEDYGSNFVICASTFRGWVETTIHVTPSGNIEITDEGRSKDYD